MSNLKRTSKEKKKRNDDSDSSEDEDDDDDENDTNKPKMDCALIKHQGCINRIRTTRVQDAIFAASWSELGRVNIWNISEQIQAVNDPDILRSYEKECRGDHVKSAFTFSGHQQEGYAIDWSPIATGVLATGDCRRDIHIWQPAEGGIWTVDQRPLVGHIDSGRYL